MNPMKTIHAHRWIAIVLIGFVALDFFLLAVPNFGVYDEIIYVPVAYNMMGLKPQPAQPTILGAPISLVSPINLTRYYPLQPLGKDFNIEQMPLSKIIMGTFLYLFAPQQVNYFWARVPSVIMSAVALISMYGIASHFLEKQKYALLATAFLNFDTLFWIHSRAALIDIYFLAFMMLGILLYLKGHIRWSIVAIALSVLSKLAGISGLAIIIAYDLIVNPKRQSFKQTFKQMLVSIAIFFAVCVPSYTIYAYIWGMSENPITNLLLYPQWLSKVNWTMTLIQGSSPSSQPWAWLLNQTPVRYAVVFDPTTGISLLSFVGQMNFTIIALAIPVVVMAGYEMVKKRTPISTLVFLWFMCTWLPYLFFTLSAQEQFIHHMVATVPTIVLGIVSWLRTQNRAFVVGYTILLVTAWVWNYPYGLLWFYIVGSPYRTLPPLNFFGF